MTASMQSSSHLLAKLSGRGAAAAGQAFSSLAGSALSGAPQGAGMALGTSFQSMLQQAHSGKMVSGLPVTAGPNSGIALTDEQLSRVSVAADQAAAAGISTAVVVVDGQAFTLDVHLRKLTGAVQPTDRAVSGIDGIVMVPSEAEEAAGMETTILPLPQGGLQNADVMALLSGSGS